MAEEEKKKKSKKGAFKRLFELFLPSPEQENKKVPAPPKVDRGTGKLIKPTPPPKKEGEE